MKSLKLFYCYIGCKNKQNKIDYLRKQKEFISFKLKAKKVSTRRLVFVGHISIDKVENINGEKNQLGGAAFYSAMAARTLSSNVILISATGKDNNFLNYLDLIPYSDVKIYNIPSTKFHIRYDDNWEAHYLKVEPGAGSKITSRRISKRWLRDKSIFHLVFLLSLSLL